MPYTSRKQHRGLDESLTSRHTTRMNFPIHRTTILMSLVLGSALLSTACVEQTAPACPVGGCEEQEDGTVVTIGDPSESEDTSEDSADASTTDGIDDPSSPSDSSTPDEPSDAQDPSEVDPSETIEDCTPPMVSALYEEPRRARTGNSRAHQRRTHHVSRRPGQRSTCTRGHGQRCTIPPIRPLPPLLLGTENCQP